MSNIPKPSKSTFNTPTYGPFRDGTVQTYFRWSPPHTSKANGYHLDFELVTPKPGRDSVRTISHIKLGS